MKPLFLILVISTFYLSANAQNFNFKPGKTTDKYGLKLKKEYPATSSLKTQQPSNLDLKLLGFSTRRDSIFSKAPVYPEKYLNNWYKKPPETTAARIPNALPYFFIPDIAAIPNPLLRSKNITRN